MSKAAAIIILVTGSAAALGFARFGRSTSQAQPRPASTDDQRILALEQRVNLLQRQLLEGPPARTENAAAPTASAQRTQAAIEAEVDTPVEVTPEQARADREEQRGAWEQRFNSEGAPNNPWAIEKEETLRTALRSSPLANAQSIRCRGNTCRIETQHPSKADAEALLDDNAMSSALLGATYYRFPLDEAKTRFVMYVEPAKLKQ